MGRGTEREEEKIYIIFITVREHGESVDLYKRMSKIKIIIAFVR